MTATHSSPGFRDRLPTRSVSDRVVGGVCGGLAAELGIDAVIVRVAAVVLAISGPGLPLYIVAWIVMPEAGGDRPAQLTPGAELRRGVGLGLIVLGSVLTLRAMGLTPADRIVWPVLLVGVGVAVVLWQVGPLIDTSRWYPARIAAGIIAAGAGIVALVAGNVSFGAVRDGLLAILLVVGGLGLILGPYIAVLVRDRRREHAQRVQADARADMAAHLHDSVLQSLALIQRTEDPKQMASLARQQERELRRWLYGDASAEETTLRVAIDRVVATVEDRFGVAVEAVVVGDADVDVGVEALVAATREAATNAAKWSGCDRVSIFVEVEPEGVRAYVRDTGAGFVPTSVAEDRLGLRQSIRGRMERVGGSAEVTSAVGEGTEVELFVPLG